jgi:hypothetical protein
MRRFALLSAVVLASATPALAQGGMTMAAPAAGKLSIAASPRATAALAVSTGVRGVAPMKVVIDYGQPFARGRVVEGTLIPAGQVWRTGANAATSLVTEANLQIGTVSVPKGSYTLYSLWTPGKGMQLIINKQTGQWGTEYKQEMDLARIPMTVTKSATVVEKFEITVTPAGNGGEIALHWDTMKAAATFTK